METIADRIKQIRKKNKLNQTDFGKKIGVTRSVIKNIELNTLKNGIPDNIIKLIAATFNFREEWIYTGKKPEKETNTSLIDKISDEYKLDDFQKKLVYEYLNLTNQQKNAVKSFLDKIYNFDTKNFGEENNSDISKESTDEQSIHTKKLTVEERADVIGEEFGEKARQGYLSEKKPESQALFANESDAG